MKIRCIEIPGNMVLRLNVSGDEDLAVPNNEAVESLGSDIREFVKSAKPGDELVLRYVEYTTEEWDELDSWDDEKTGIGEAEETADEAEDNLDPDSADTITRLIDAKIELALLEREQLARKAD